MNSEPAHEPIIQSQPSAEKREKGWLCWALPPLFAALALKLALLAANAFPLNADEAIVGLMARHILEGRWPVFFYGQAYMGSLDATLAAGAFAVMGPSVLAIRIMQCLLFLGTVATTVLLARRYLGSWKTALLAGLLLALPAVNVTLYTTVSLGGYGEALLLGNLLMLLALFIKDHPTLHLPYLAWGFLAGLGLWAFGLTLIYALPTGIFVGVNLWRTRSRWWRKALAILGGMILGAAPWIGFAMTQGIGPLLSELGGSAIAVENGSGLLADIARRMLSLAVFGTTVTAGLRPPWDILWLALPLAPFVLAFWIGVLFHGGRSLRRERQGRALYRVLAGVCATLLLGFLLTPFGNDPSGRYFVPLAVPLALMGADFVLWLRRRTGSRLSYLLIPLVLGFNLWGTVQGLMASRTGLTTQFDPVTQIDHAYDDDLIDFLAQQAEVAGYTNYWVAYPLAFNSSEELIFIPRLPYHHDFRYTERDDRYAPYDEIVDASPRAAYITTHHPALDEYLRSSFTELGVAWSEARIGDYQVFYGLSAKVSPQEIGLGTTTP